MKPHNLYVRSQDDPKTMRFGYILSCTGCKSRVFTWLNLTYLKTIANDRDHLKENMEKKLFAAWKKEIPPDCDEARAVNLVREIHGS
jgi:hypothetical protein